MSRPAASKSRSEKARGGQSAPTPAVTREIVPGKFTDLDWNFALDLEENDDFVGGIVQEIAENALTIIHEKYLEKQLVPYTVSQAKDAMLILLEWQFLAHDLGEPDITDSCADWAEDEEPPCCLVDAWGQGAMPMQVVSPRLSSRQDSPLVQTATLQNIQEEDIRGEGSESAVEEELLTEEREISQVVTEIIEHVVDEVVATEKKKTPPATPPQSPVDEKSEPEHEHEPETEINLRRKVKFQPYRGAHLHSAHLHNLTETLYETELQQQLEEYIAAGWLPEVSDSDPLTDMPASCHSILKVQAGRPPGNKEVIYDEHGNVMSVVKIPPERLPSHRVKVNVRVVDPAVEAANKRLEAMKKGRRYTTNTQKAATVKTEAPRHLRSMAASKQQFQRQQPLIVSDRSRDENLVDPLPPSLVDTISLSAGVLIREGDRVKKGPRQRASQSDTLPEASIRSLRPVQMKSPGPGIAVTELVPRVAIRPLGDAKPIPPIKSVH